MILIDTQVLVWLFEGVERLGKRALKRIEAADTVHVSAISFWEMAMLVEKDRLALLAPLPRWKEMMIRQGIRIVPIDADLALEAGSLPGTIHGDPADRLLVATARYLACPLLTSDRQILDYAQQGHLHAFDARL